MEGERARGGEGKRGRKRGSGFFSRSQPSPSCP